MAMIFKKTISVVGLVFLCASAFAANPSFQSFDQTFFATDLYNITIRGFTNTSTVWLATNGDDTTAVLGRSDLPAKTFFKANTLAYPVGATVIVMPGLYSTNGIVTNGVNYFFYPGATVFYKVTSTNEMGWGIVDTRLTGATTNIIAGAGDFKYQSYTGAVFTLPQGQTVNPLCYGPVIVTNDTDNITMDGNSIGSSMFGSGGQPTTIFIYNCSYSSFRFKQLYSLSGTNVVNVYTRISNGQVFTKQDRASGVIWETGNSYFFIDDNRACGAYAIWPFIDPTGNPLSVTKNADMWYRGSYCDGKFYVDSTASTNKNWRCWVDIDTWELGNKPQQVGDAIAIYGSGKFYINAKKIQSGPFSTALLDCSTITGSTNAPEVWLTWQKLTVTNSPLMRLKSYAKIHASGLEVQDLGNNPQPWMVSVEDFAKLDFSCASPIVISNGGFLIHSSSNYTRIANTTIDTSSINGATNWIAFVANSNLIFSSCNLVAPVAAEAITATNAQTVGMYGSNMSSKTNSPNITLSPLGSFTVSATVR